MSVERLNIALHFFSQLETDAWWRLYAKKSFKSSLGRKCFLKRTLVFEYVTQQRDTTSNEINDDKQHWDSNEENHGAKENQHHAHQRWTNASSDVYQTQIRFDEEGLWIICALWLWNRSDDLQQQRSPISICFVGHGHSLIEICRIQWTTRILYECWHCRCKWAVPASDRFMSLLRA